jgi:hypothetical protein
MFESYQVIGFFAADKCEDHKVEIIDSDFREEVIARYYPPRRIRYYDAAYFSL